MNSSTVEITEKEYCIKLSKDAFDLSLIRQLITRIQSEQLFFSRSKDEMEDDIISRAAYTTIPENLDRLSEK